MAKALSLLLLSLPFLFSVGCSSTSEEPEDAAKEVPLSEAPPMEGTEDDLFATAKKLYANGYYLVATDAFRSVADGFPLGPYSEFSEIKVADSLFIRREYDEAAVRYEEILKNFPSSQSAPYVTMKAGRSFQKINTDLGRDREPLEKAIAFYQAFLERFPQSMFRPQVEEFLRSAQRAIAEHEQMVAQFYRKRGYTEASEKRERSYQLALQNFGLADAGTSAASPPVVIASAEKQGDTSSPELVKLGRASVSKSGLTALDAEAKSPNLQTSPRPVIVSGAVIRDVGDVLRREQAGRFSRSLVRDISCSTRGDKKISIELNRSLGEQLDETVLQPTSGKISRELPIELERDFSMSCFQENDLRISKQGQLTLQTNTPYALVRLQHPERILFVEAPGE